MLDPKACYKALQARDDRFDGRIFVAVTTTGIYCRPVCPARPARFEHCKFYASAAAAHEAGFRPCLRCRPETTSDLGSWRGTSNTVSRGLALIAEGALDGESSIDELAERLGVGERQLRRLFRQHLGASPVSVAQTRRVLLAKQLIHETRMPMTEIALAAGYRSVRRFNEAFHALYGRPPSALRRDAGRDPSFESSSDGGVSLRLRYRPPYDWRRILAHFEARAVDGVEKVERERYMRTVVHDGQVGTVAVEHDANRASLVVTIAFPSVRALPAIVARVRRAFDLGADVGAIGQHLSQDPRMARLVAKRPGLRVPGAWDSFELGVRAILGQQVSIEHARRLGSTLARICGAPGPVARALEPSLSVAFPRPSDVAAADLGALRMPRARKEALVALAKAALAEPSLFDALDSVEQTVARLRAVRGVGEWTAQYIALRASREPDAFPASDAGLLRAAAARGARPTPDELLARAGKWRPWRAYAAQHLWSEDAESEPR